MRVRFSDPAISKKLGSVWVVPREVELRLQNTKWAVSSAGFAGSMKDTAESATTLIGEPGMASKALAPDGSIHAWPLRGCR